MFHKTRRRLVIVNASVLLFILLTLGTLLYIQMYYRLYHDIDETLKQSESRIHSISKLDELMHSDLRQLQEDENTIYLFWNADNELIGQLPDHTFTVKKALKFMPSSSLHQIVTIGSEKKSYRVLQTTYQEKSAHTSEAVKKITIIKHLGDIKDTLHTLQHDIGGGLVIGLLISLVAGYFLAGRSLIPIRRSWERQQQFVADASHELRTPTAVIQAQTELLLRKPDHTIEQESEHISKILSESKRMGKLVDDLLTLARTDSNQLQLQTVLFSLDTLLSEVAEQFRFLAEIKDVSIDTNIQTSVLLRGDENRIRQLLIILLDNALKFTAPQGQIQITGRSLPHAIMIQVADDGCGIPEADLPHVFKRFYRGDKSRSRAVNGTGLGLSIAKWIVQAHGGKIHIHSRVNVGTTVEILLPKSK